MKIKIAKNLKNLKNTIMASFRAKIGWKRPRKTENKNYRSVPFRSYPALNRKLKKNSKKSQKIKEYHYGLISSQKIKIIIPFRSNPTHNRKFQKNRKKIKKSKKYKWIHFKSK